ncbi:MAG: glucosaminidase domain-containing protein, partial [Saprospiraceae bacterium]|nr:glucosaminidase domain-containing protein [Saprospiraceae bacterium]
GSIASGNFMVQKIGDWVSRRWFRLFLLFLFGYVFFCKDISISVGMNTAGQLNHKGTGSIESPVLPTAYHEKGTDKAPETRPPAGKKWQDRRANTFSNLTFVLSPDYGERKGLDPAIAREKVQACKDYVTRYAATAMKEKEVFGIPASITLAQGLLESNAGNSRLSVESNNHFGIKCRSKCRGCTCRNYTDDDVYDMFRVFESPWESFREHSKLLDSARYRHLKKLGSTDYKGWAYGLKRAGYATDKRYAEKLIQIIDFLDLHQYDE